MKTSNIKKTTWAACLAGTVALGSSVAAEDIIKVRLMGSDLAADIARGAVQSCREMGYQVAAVVLDRAGDTMASQRDTFARRHTLEIAARKAGLSIMSGVASVEMRDSREDIRAELNHMDGIIVMEGGIPIRAAGSLVGAVGVSGAPGGDIDANCANAGIEAVQDRIDFAD
ncbi:heme-binding protein [Hwanghaeella grinnelliae]|uniref:Heme-binding protein n=1 Tax=Hwanghaeella grinnelliae TaxID=2500179 RepID=A0A3S2WAY9_9PROT|nr:heme-binding protein [Hwanghaeella grinnelliae]RVU38261.1 heme-binding protein [Hwanghaeella grinnelliae]